MSLIRQAIQDLLEAPAYIAADVQILEPPPEPEPPRRGLKPAPPDPEIYGTLTAEQGYEAMQDAITTYLALEAPAHMLLIAAPAGLGKTTLAVATAERHAAGGQRAMYVMPRRDFYADLMALARQPAWWYNWQPRTLGPGQGIGQTCRYAPQMEQWLRRGYDSLRFCSNERICGWSYINNDCPYHAQRSLSYPIIATQYEHVTLGHPLLDQCSLLIGDEIPLRAFVHEWRIPVANIVPGDMEPGPWLSLMQALRSLVPTLTDKAVLSGEALLAALGGPAFVAQATASVPASALEPPDLRHADAAEQAPYGHLFVTLQALQREAAEAVAGRPCISRVQLDRHGLILLGRRTPKHLPQHMIWLDATGDAALYRRLFGRPVEVVTPDVRLAGRVYQVWSSLNTKRQTIREDGDGVKISHLRQQVAHIRATGGYERLGIVSYQDVAAELGGDTSLHFYGSRGTNAMADVDALVVVGTPQPDGNDFARTAAMVYHERTAPFTTTWTTQDRPYASQPWAYPVSHYWDDPDLYVLLSQFREAELVQALHRARPLRRPVDVWLLTNLPLPRIPVTLVSLHQLFDDAPADVDPYRWPAVVRLAQERVRTVQRLTSADLVEAGLCQPATARRYLTALATRFDWIVAPAPAQGRGKPPLAVMCKELSGSEY